ncbi:MAG TPA: mannitol dehydrogenase family protein [Ramlibacter sp.]|nr:mannitol dehydrogenase family protein [Ramlibacter sp.]
MPRILHLGLGAFHRAHQAVYLQRLIDSGDTTWTLAGGNLRPDQEQVIVQLRAQGGAYHLLTIEPDGSSTFRRIAAIREVVPWDADLADLRRLARDPETRIISFTVTEGGYLLRPGGGLDRGSAEVRAAAADARQGRPGTTWHGALACLLRERMAAGAGPVTLLCCDNLRHNGDRSRAALLDFIELLPDPGLAEWVRRNTTSPNGMVDRITPRPTLEVALRLKEQTGQDDPCGLMAEGFIQWVVEDDFAAGRPPWERVGVEMTASVQPWEEAKIRLLNATHSCLAWAGALAGLSFVHEAVADDRIRAVAHRYASDAAIPLLQPSPLDLPAYRDTVLARFGNAAIRDTNQRVASDSFAKIPAFLAPTVRECLARRRPLEPVAAVAALFAAFLQRWAAGSLPFDYQDASMDPQLARSVAATPRALAALPVLWGEAADAAAWREAVAAEHGRLAAPFR